MNPISLGNVQIQPVVRDGRLLSLGAVRVGDLVLRNPVNRFLPWFDTYEGGVFNRFEVVSSGPREDGQPGWVIETRAFGDSDYPFMERRDCSGDVCLRRDVWDAPPLEATLRIVFEPAVATVDGLELEGFKYWYEYSSETTPIHRLLDRQTWEIGGNLDDVTVVCRNLFDAPVKKVGREDTYSTISIDTRANLLPGNLWARWSLIQSFDMQVGADAVLLGWFDSVACIRSAIESAPGEDWIRVVDCHYFEQSLNVTTTPKTILVAPVRLDATDTLNLWTRLHDRERARVATQFNIDLAKEPDAGVVLGVNVWQNFRFDKTYDSAVALAAEFGMEYIFIDSVFENGESVRRELVEIAGGDAALKETVLGKTAQENMCCTYDFEVSKAAGGEAELQRLCERAAALDVKVISWMATHYSPRSAMADRNGLGKGMGHGKNGIFAAKESGFHPDTGYAMSCWTVNLNAPVANHLRDQVIGVCERTGLAGYLWDSFSNLGWWQVDYSDGSMRPQFDRMAGLYADFVNRGLYVMPEAVVSFCNKTACGFHGGNFYATPGIEGYAYQTHFHCSYGPDQPGAANRDMVPDMLRGKVGTEPLFRLFAHRCVAGFGMEVAGQRDAWNPVAVAAVKGIFAAYQRHRDLMRVRTVLPDDAGVLWTNDGDTALFWSFAEQSWPGAAGLAKEALSGRVVADGTFAAWTVYRLPADLVASRVWRASNCLAMSDALASR